jgi:hypothetical protein
VNIEADVTCCYGCEPYRKAPWVATAFWVLEIAATDVARAGELREIAQLRARARCLFFAKGWVSSVIARRRARASLINRKMFLNGAREERGTSLRAWETRGAAR